VKNNKKIIRIDTLIITKNNFIRKLFKEFTDIFMIIMEEFAVIICKANIEKSKRCALTRNIYKNK